MPRLIARALSAANDAGIVPPTLKRCTRCGNLKRSGIKDPASAFPIQKDNRNGSQILRESPWCNGCHAAYCKAWQRKKRARSARRLLPR